ncbi:hypothetical protein ACW2QC_05105 [Virgibacillus sp. FSP13]
MPSIVRGHLFILRTLEEHRRENRGIGARAETSAREQKHRRESRNIGARAETSAPEQKHRFETESIQHLPTIIQ